MRTTITLDDEAGEVARMYAESRDISLSKALSELVLQAVQPKMRIKYIDGIPVFDVPPERTISNKKARRLMAEEM
jgi:hypothetical protein